MKELQQQLVLFIENNKDTKDVYLRLVVDRATQLLEFIELVEDLLLWKIHCLNN